MSDLLREDEANRRRALELESFIVEAPAGAGKTELLTQRYLRLLAIADEPEEIVAITFTNKAAGEMRNRIAESLVRARSGVAPEAAHKRITFDLARAALARSAQRDWAIEQQPGRLRLTTIDALCAGLARQMPLLSRFGAQPATVEDAGRHYREAARRALDHLDDADADAGHVEAVAAALAWMDNDAARLIDLLAAMLARREQWRPLAELDDPQAAIGAALDELLAEELMQVETMLDAGWQAPWMPLARFAAAQLGAGALLEWSAPLVAEVDQLSRWRALAAFLLTQDDTVRKTVNVRNGFPAGKEFKAQKDAMLAALAEVDQAQLAALVRLRQLPAPGKDGEGGDGIVRALTRLMKLAAAELWLVFREAGEVDFGELATRAIDALGEDMDPSELGLRLDWCIRHLLVDEFQDTSPTQIRLLERLTAGWSAGDGRTLFCVGDPMQSIYRFRKAEVGLFLRAKSQGIGNLSLTPLRLSRNNRACAPVVAWINDGFPALFPALDEPLRGEIAYRPFVDTRADLPAAGVTVHALVAAKGDGDATGRIEAARMLQIIEAEWRADPQRRIAVLVRARDHLSALVAAIRREYPAWRYTAVEIEPLAGRQVVQDLISLTRALHHRGDRLHWLAILRAPWCGLRLADLHALAGDDHDATIPALLDDGARIARLSADGRRRALHLRAVMREALAGQGRQSRRRWVEDAWKKLGGPSCLVTVSGAADAAALADADACFKRLDELDAARRFALDDFEQDMARLFAAPDAEADGHLQLMTIHKAKGLEFDTVILPGLHRPSPLPEPPLLAWDSFPLAEGERLVVAPMNRRRRQDEPTTHDFLQAMERERAANEAARVLYVAVTRAVRHLHLLGVAARKEDGSLAAAPTNSLLAKLWPVVERDFVAANVAAAAVPENDDGMETWFVPPLLRLVAPAVPPAWQAPPELSTAASVREDTVDALAADIGSLVHALLEMVAAKPGDWSPAAIPAREAGFARWLAGRGWGATEARAGAEKAARILATTLASADGQWVVRQREDAGAEIAIARVAEGGQHADARVETRVVDRSFVEDGVRWIIDYKTADLGPGADAARLAAHAENYRPQLENYAALFAGEGRPLRLAVFFAAHGILSALE
ncbi:MAG: UvrD-helicase domain-containing protein [Rhodocyclales bacterium]|nr:UvrD-helicase domain-containing protein [Rhodocyclales bacterium]